MCDCPPPGPLSRDAIARLNAARWQELVVRVLRGLHLYVAAIDDFICTPCANRFRRAPIVVPLPVREC